jgi:hypothetical protein
MIPVLPVSMIPAAARAATPVGFVLAVVIGLAIFAASQNKQQTPPAQQK